MAVHTDAGTPAVGRVQELKRSCPSAKIDLRAVQGERRAMRAEEPHLLDIRKRLEGQVVILGAELRAAQVELTDLTSHCSELRKLVNT